MCIYEFSFCVCHCSRDDSGLRQPRTVVNRLCSPFSEDRDPRLTRGRDCILCMSLFQRRLRAAPAAHGGRDVRRDGGLQPGTSRPLQDIRVSIWGLCASQYYSWHSTPPPSPPPRCMLQLILRNMWQYMDFPRLPCVAIQHIMLAIAILCKGQGMSRPWFSESYKLKTPRLIVGGGLS